MTIYFLGSYIAVIIYALLLDITDFREYMAEISDELMKLLNVNGHSYTMLVTLSIFVVLFSWFSLVGIIMLFYDYIDMKIKNKK